MYFQSFTLTTLFLGWWGFASFLITFVILFNNVSQYWGARHLSPPSLITVKDIAAPPPALTSATEFAVKLIYGVIVWGGILGVVAYLRIDFVERHAPSLNAAMHDQGFDDENDSIYSIGKIAKDVAALGAESSTSNWADKRAELLKKELFLTDLSDRNEKLQRTMAIERAKNAGMNDACERWMLDEFGPALLAYTQSENLLFAFAKGNAEIRLGNDAALAVVSAQEEESSQALRRVLGKARSVCSQ
jgi:hypothetical protein